MRCHVDAAAVQPRGANPKLILDRQRSRIAMHVSEVRRHVAACPLYVSVCRRSSFVRGGGTHQWASQTQHTSSTSRVWEHSLLCVLLVRSRNLCYLYFTVFLFSFLSHASLDTQWLALAGVIQNLPFLPNTSPNIHVKWCDCEIWAVVVMNRWAPSRLRKRQLFVTRTCCLW